MEVNYTVCQITPEHVEPVYFTEDDGLVTLCEPDGTPLDPEAGVVTERVKERTTADAIARKLFRARFSDFNRPINYGATGWR